MSEWSVEQMEHLIAEGWKEHADQPEAVLARLEAALGGLGVGQTPAFVGLATHIYAVHLGWWEAGLDLLARLEASVALAGGEPAANAVQGARATLRLGRGDADALDGVGGDARIVALANASSALAERGAWGRALEVYQAALDLAEAGLADGSPALRALAAGGNNLAADLENKADRTAAETAGMVQAARSALVYWRRAGTWLHEERAEYRLARSLVAAGRPAEAVEAARRCIDGCVANEAPAFERFFGYAVLALSHRAAGDRAAFEGSRGLALELLEQVPADERPWCEHDARELDG